MSESSSSTLRSSGLFLAALLLSGCGGGSAGGEEPIAVPIPAPGEWPVAVQPSEDGPAFERVILVTLDTLRADHVSSYGYPRETTPFIDSLAERGVRFENVIAASSQTAPSHTTMLTGLVPSVHGLLENGSRLDPGARDLARVFEAAGYESAALLNVMFLVGLCEGFGHVGVSSYDERLMMSSDVVDSALLWFLSQRESPRFFLWVHLYDPHKWKDAVIQYSDDPESLWTKESPDDFFETVTRLHGLPAPREGEPYSVRWKINLKAGESIDAQSPEGFMRCIDAYDSLTCFTDMQVQRLYAAIEGAGLPGRTLWVITSDHGEGLASHGIAGHGARIYQEQLKVPLVLHASDDSLGPRVVEDLVGHVDLYPTLLEAIGLRTGGTPGLYEGRSLWPLLRGERSGWNPGPVFAQRRPANGQAKDELVSLQDQRWKFILHEPGDDLFFDLEADPNELNDLGGESESAAALRAGLQERLRAYSNLIRGGADEEVPEEWMQELRDLGYVR